MIYNRAPKRRRWLKLAAILVAVLAVAGVVAAGFGYRYYTANLKPLNSNTKTVDFMIAPGQAVQQIAVNLQAQGLIRSSLVFEQYVRLHHMHNKIQAGTYSLSPSQSVADIVGIIAQGRVQSSLFTVLPANRIDQVQAAMVNAGFDAAEVQAAFDPQVYVNHPALADKPPTASLEGYLYPDSYQVTANSTPQDIIRQSLDKMQSHLTPAVRAGFAAQGLSVHQAITLASIVEREVGSPADRQTVAQVFLLRLKEDINLESDATASYGAVLAGKAPSMAYESAYNTYNHPGLPPGPISNVGDSSLQAVANPSSTSWLFFVSGDDGKTYFSSTAQQHGAYVRAHCQTLCAPH